MGVCVECEDDCDCGVNEYCGIDRDKSVPDWSNYQFKVGDPTGPMFSWLKVKIESFKDYKIRSKCLKYVLPSSYPCETLDALELAVSKFEHKILCIHCIDD
jgi:hypothetical protein